MARGITLGESRHISNQWTQHTALDQVSDLRPSPTGARAERFLVAPRPREGRTLGHLRFNPTSRCHHRHLKGLQPPINTSRSCLASWRRWSCPLDPLPELSILEEGTQGDEMVSLQDTRGRLGADLRSWQTRTTGLRSLTLRSCNAWTTLTMAMTGRTRTMTLITTRSWRARKRTMWILQPQLHRQLQTPTGLIRFQAPSSLVPAPRSSRSTTSMTSSSRRVGSGLGWMRRRRGGTRRVRR